MVATWETGYGNDHVVFVLPNGVAMAVCWEGDNMGPPDLSFVNSTVDCECVRGFPKGAECTIRNEEPICTL